MDEGKGSRRPAQAPGHYSLAWICALPIEMAAARIMLDEEHEPMPVHPDDANTYTLGRVANHGVVIVCLPGQFGLVNAANVATDLKRSFPSIRAALVVGIGGGAPNMAVDLRLGDIVVGTKVIQSDWGKYLEAGRIHNTAFPRLPSRLLDSALSTLRAEHELQFSRVASILEEKLNKYPSFGKPAAPDQLFQSTYDHETGQVTCDVSRLVRRCHRASGEPQIHYGAIASGNQVVRNAKQRDELARELDAICFEMETAGLMDILPALPIRGICDYADSHKNKKWQKYAAITAAAFAKELLGALPASMDMTPRAVTSSFSHKAEAPDARPNFDEALTNDDKIVSSDGNANRESKEEAEHAKEEREQHRRTLLMDSLRFEQIGTRLTNIEPAISNTCQWFLNHPEYQAWISPSGQSSPDQHGFLWLRGKAGAGKSTMMKFLYSRAKRRLSRANTLVISFFFNARGDVLERSTTGMYRSLLWQLLQGFPDLQTILNDTDLVPRSRAGCPHFVELKQLFRAAASRLGQRSVLCYIDALDECDEQQVRDMIVFFQDIVVDIEKKGPVVRICVSSRPYPHIQTRLGHTITLEQQHGHRIDLLEYVNRRLLVTGSLATELRAGLLEKASGVFMWVVLAVDMLNDEHNQGSGGSALRSILDQLPPQLSDLFRSILLRDSKHTERLRLSLWWVLGAKMPLHPEAFCHAVSFWEFPRTPDQFGLWEQPDVPRLEDQRRLVTVYSKGLVEVTKDDWPRVQFIHESVRDFLIKDRGVQELWPDVGFDWEGHCKTLLKECCVAYLNYSFTAVSLVSRTLSDVNLLMSSSSFRDISRLVPFLEHAWKHLTDHKIRFEATDFVSNYQTRLSRYPLLDWVKIVNYFRVLACSKSIILFIRPPALAPVDDIGDSNNCRDPTDGAGSAYVTLSFGTPIDKIFYPIFINADIATNTSLMTWASWHGDGSSQYDLVDVVRLLVALGVGYGQHAEAVESKSPCIAPNNKATLMQQLIAAGADVNQPIDGSPPLGFAVREGKYAFCEMLLQAGATVNTRDHSGQTPLILAAIHAHDRICGLLLKYGADVEARDQEGFSAIYFAIIKGNTACVRRLVEAGADLGAKFPGKKWALTPIDMNKWSRTLLEIAFEKFIGAGIVGILLEAGAEVTTLIGSHGETLLHLIAGRKGCSEDLEAARFLIQAGADVNAATPSSLTPLRCAQDRGKRELCKLLEAHGAQRYSHPWLKPRQALPGPGGVNPLKRLRDT